MADYLNADGTPRLDVVWNADALDLLRALPEGSIDLIATDPPYFQVKPDWWDWQWNDRDAFIGWIYTLAQEWQRVLKPNGSLYVFASPQMGARVEVEIGKLFNVLNSISWWKTTGNRNWSADKEATRGFLPNTERIVFAEQFDNFGNILKKARQQKEITSRELTEIAGAYANKNNGGAVSNWESGKNIPKREHYEAIKDILQLPDYDQAIRPFNITADDQFADVWFFAPVSAYGGKHPAEKPLRLMEHIIKASSKPGALVLDPFCGSGTTCDAARRMGRHYIGSDLDPHWAAYSAQRLALPYTPDMFDTPPVPAETPTQRALFD